MAKPKLALIPAAQGTKFYSVLPSDGTGDFTFTRSSVATRINAQGLIENVASGQSRLDYPLIDGVQKGCPHHILEPARTQKLQYSEDFSQSIWTKDNTNLSSGFISPDGTANAYKLTENTAQNSRHRLYSEASTVNNGATLSTSIFVKSAERSWILLRESTTDYGYYFNNGIAGSKTGSPLSYNIESFPNGWYRYTVTTVTPNTSGRLILSIVTEDGGDRYDGDGTSGVYIWGAMLEEGSYPTSYIPNNGNAAGVTRSAETATGAGNSTTFNDSEGVLMAEISALADDLTYRFISLSDGTSNNRISLYYGDASNRVTYEFKSEGVASYLFSNTAVITNFNKILVKYKLNDFQLWINGFKILISTSGAAPVGLSSLNFDSSIGADKFSGKTKEVQYFDSALADTQLEQLTSWQSFRDMANGQLYTIE